MLGIPGQWTIDSPLTISSADGQTERRKGEKKKKRKNNFAGAVFKQLSFGKIFSFGKLVDRLHRRALSDTDAFCG